MEKEKNNSMCQMCYGFKNPRGYTQILFECRCIEDEMVLLTELPIYNHISHSENIETRAEEKKLFQPNETVFEDTDSGLGDSTPPSPTWSCDQESQDIQIESDVIYNTDKRSDTKFVYSENLICDSSNSTTSIESNIPEFHSLAIDENEFKLSNAQNSPLCQKNSCKSYKPLVLDRPETKVPSNPFHTSSSLNLSHLNSLKIASTPQNIETQESETILNLYLHHCLQHSQNHMKVVDNKKSYRRSIKSFFNSTFKTLNKSLQSIGLKDDSKPQKHSNGTQSWADIRVPTKFEQKL